MSSTHPTTVTAPPGTPFIEVVRDVDAPRPLVFRAFTDPTLVTQWLGPRRYEMVLDHWDARTGGSWAYAHRAGDEEYGFFGTFHSVVPDTRAVQTFEFAGAPGHVSLDEVTFEDLPGGGTRIITRSVHQSVESRDAMVGSGMADGMSEGYDRLDELLASDVVA
ncbi:SRPBCC family protein [Oerskovia jenensis]|uniref:SRPBCC family protein n=1 Tax=Oerskovia jenensis TaxID=162169 RepID=UPI0036DBDC1E